MPFSTTDTFTTQEEWDMLTADDIDKLTEEECEYYFYSIINNSIVITLNQDRLTNFTENIDLLCLSPK